MFYQTFANITLHCLWGCYWRPKALWWFRSPCIHHISVVFLRIKNRLQGCYFETTNSSQKAVTNTLKDFTDKDFQQCFQRLKECLEWCVASEGNYLGGDHILAVFFFLRKSVSLLFEQTTYL